MHTEVSLQAEVGPMDSREPCAGACGAELCGLGAEQPCQWALGSPLSLPVGTAGQHPSSCGCIGPGAAASQLGVPGPAPSGALCIRSPEHQACGEVWNVTEPPSNDKTEIKP